MPGRILDEFKVGRKIYKRKKGESIEFDKLVNTNVVFGEIFGASKEEKNSKNI